MPFGDTLIIDARSAPVLSELQDGENAEIGKVVLGLPPLQAHLPIKRGALGRLTRWLHPTPAQFVRVWTGHSTIWSSEDDDGSINLYLDVVNVGKTAVHVRHVHLRQLLVGGYDLSISSPLFTPPDDDIAAGDLQRAYVRAAFGAPGVRLLIRTIITRLSTY